MRAAVLSILFFTAVNAAGWRAKQTGGENPPSASSVQGILLGNDACAADPNGSGCLDVLWDYCASVSDPTCDELLVTCPFDASAFSSPCAPTAVCQDENSSTQECVDEITTYCSLSPDPACQGNIVRECPFQLPASDPRSPCSEDLCFQDPDSAQCTDITLTYCSEFPTDPACVGLFITCPFDPAANFSPCASGSVCTAEGTTPEACAEEIQRYCVCFNSGDEACPVYDPVPFVDCPTTSSSSSITITASPSASPDTLSVSVSTSFSVSITLSQSITASSTSSISLSATISTTSSLSSSTSITSSHSQSGGPSPSLVFPSISPAPSLGSGGGGGGGNDKNLGIIIGAIIGVLAGVLLVVFFVRRRRDRPQPAPAPAPADDPEKGLGKTDGKPSPIPIPIDSDEEDGGGPAILETPREQASAGSQSGSGGGAASSTGDPLDTATRVTPPPDELEGIHGTPRGEDVEPAGPNRSKVSGIALTAVNPPRDTEAGIHPTPRPEDGTERVGSSTLEEGANAKADQPPDTARTDTSL